MTSEDDIYKCIKPAIDKLYAAHGSKKEKVASYSPELFKILKTEALQIHEKHVGRKAHKDDDQLISNLVARYIKSKIGQ